MSDTLREIRDVYGVKRAKVKDVYPGTEHEPDADTLIQLTHEQRLRRVVNALIDAGIHPGPSAVNFCCFRHADHHLNGRDTRVRREVMLERGMIRDELSGRWRTTAETRRSVDFRRHGLEARA